MTDSAAAGPLMSPNTGNLVRSFIAGQDRPPLPLNQATVQAFIVAVAMLSV